MLKPFILMIDDLSHDSLQSAIELKGGLMQDSVFSSLEATEDTSTHIYFAIRAVHH